jgi:hypothetical protein
MGFEQQLGTPEAFAALIESEIAIWAKGGARLGRQARVLAFADRRASFSEPANLPIPYIQVPRVQIRLGGFQPCFCEL